MSLNEDPITIPGRRGFVGNRATVVTPAPETGGGGGFAPDNIYWVSPAGDLESFDGVKYSTIQSALDAANTASPTQSDQYVVVAMPGNYDEGTLTMYQYVHLVGWGGDSAEDRHGVQIALGTSSSVWTVQSAADSSISNVFFYANGTTGMTGMVQVTHDTFVMRDCSSDLTTGVVEFDLQAGQFFNQRFINGTVQINGDGTNWPKLFNCYGFTTSNVNGFQLTTAGSTDVGVWLGGGIKQFDTTTTLTSYINVTSPGVRLEGLEITTAGSGGGEGDNIQFDGTMVGCYVKVEENSAFNKSHIETAGGAKFVGNHFEFTSTSKTGASATTSCIFIEDLNDDVVFTGNTFNKEIDRTFIMLGSGISSDEHKVICNGNTFRTDSNTAGQATFGIHSTGFSGTVVWELNGNYYYGRDSSMPTNAGSGRILWRGTDIKATFIPASAEWGTGTASENDNFPGVLLDTATETAFIVGRANPPAGILIDAGLVLSANNTNGIDTDAMTDTDNTQLSAHTPTGGSGTWTIVTGDIRIRSNRARFENSGANLATYSVGASNGFLRCTPDAVIGSGENVAGLIFRYSNTSNYWRLVAVDDSPRLRLIKKVAGSDTTVWDDTIATADIAVSFNGDTIRVYEDYDGTPRLVAEIVDSALETNTSVGVYGEVSGSFTFVDDWEWHPGGDVDITVATDQAHLHQPFSGGSTSDDDGVDVLHHAYSIHDVAFGVNEELSQVKVTLDVKNGDIDEVYVHGLLVRHLPINNEEGPPSQEDRTPEAGIFVR